MQGISLLINGCRGKLHLKFWRRLILDNLKGSVLAEKSLDGALYGTDFPVINSLMQVAMAEA